MATADDLLHITIVATFDNKIQEEKVFALRRKPDGNFTIVSFSGDVDSVGTTVESMCNFLSTNMTIMKMTLRKTPFNHDVSLVCGFANRLVQAKASNEKVKHIVVNLEDLFLELVVKGLTFSTNSIFVLGLRDMRVPNDTAELEANMNALKPGKLGLRVLKDCPPEILSAVAKGLQNNDSFKILSLEDIDKNKATAVAEILNACPSVESVGFPKGSFTEPIARVFLQQLEPGRISGKLTISDTEITSGLGMVLEQLLEEKLTGLKSLDVAHNHFTHDAFGALCLGLQSHPTLKSFTAAKSHLAGGNTTTFTRCLASLFQKNKTMENFNLSGINLAFCDATCWASLAQNKTLKKISLLNCFQNPKTWLEIYQGLLKERNAEVSWFLGDTSTVDMKYNSMVISLNYVEKSNYKEFDWILPVLKEMSTISHHLFVDSAAMGKTLGRELPDIVACNGVKSLEMAVDSKDEATALLTSILSEKNGSEGESTNSSTLGIVHAVIPNASSSLSEIKFRWKAEKEDQNKRTPTAICVHLH